VLQQYLEESYLFREAYQNSCPFKIVDHKRFRHGIIIHGYSDKFLRMFYYDIDDGISYEKIRQIIEKLKSKELKLYQALFILWGIPVESYPCHKSTVYRRLQRALQYIAKESGILKAF
jgi:hypothetical protein